MLVVNFNEKLLEGKFLPIMDTYTSIDDLIARLEEISEEYDVKNIFLAGHSIVASVAHEGDYTCLVAEVNT